MSIFASTDVLSIIVTLFGGGSIAAMVTLFYNHLMRKRQERLDMERLRLDSISKAAPYYSRLAVYNCYNLAHMLRMPNENRDYELMFYYLCNTLYLRRIIIQKFGEIQLADLEAEEIIGILGITIEKIVNDGFGNLGASRIRYLVENDLPFHRFHESITSDQNRDLYQKFVHWICRQEIITELERNCRWYTQLIMFEMNHIYESWYRQPPYFRLDEDLLQNLLQNHSGYYDRITSFYRSFFRGKRNTQRLPK